MSFAVDVNILLYASDESSPLHGKAVDFLGRCAGGPEVFCLAWLTVMSYLRIATHPTIFARPLLPAEALQNIESLLGLPHCRPIGEQQGFLAAYRDIALPLSARGNLVPDAHLATVLLQNRVLRLYTHDRDFRRFDFLTVSDPLG